MTDRPNKGFAHAAWGYFFLSFNLNAGHVGLLPNFVGYLLFLLAIRDLEEERRDLALLRPLCVLLAAWNALDWLAGWFGGDIDGQVLFLDLLAAAAGLYFQYQFLTDLAALAEIWQPEGRNLDVKLRKRRTAYIVMVTALSLFTDLTAPWAGEDWRVGITIVLMLISMAAALTVMSALFRLCGSVRKENMGV